MIAYREVLRLEIAEAIGRRQAENRQRNIEFRNGLSWGTVLKYLAAAKEAGVVREGPVPSEGQLNRLFGISRSGPRRSEAPIEERLEVFRIQELLADRACRVAYTSLHGFVARRNWRGRSWNTFRMGENTPREVAELDFGSLRLIPFPQTGPRKAFWARALVLRHSVPIA